MHQSVLATSNVYGALARRLDTIPNGFPATESGAELRLLAKLYTLEEASLASVMRLTAESAEAIAGRAEGDPVAVQDTLKGMARRGLIRVERSARQLKFGLMPFVVGVYEGQLARMDAELARLFEDYYQESHGRVIVSTAPSVHRVIPVDQAIPSGTEVFPYEHASGLLEGAMSFGVRDCICRVQRGMLGQACSAPVSSCVIFHPNPGAFDHSNDIRPISKDEAIQILRQASEFGLVHSSANVQQGHGYICNCCTCCCGILRALSEFGNADAVARSAFHVAIDPDLCAACESCLDSCPFHALSLTGFAAEVDLTRCMGCGLCVPVCPSEAITMVRKPEWERDTPPLDDQAWWLERAANRQIDLGDIL
jgi:electron transport complex protein RnfB